MYKSHVILPYICSIYWILDARKYINNYVSSINTCQDFFTWEPEQDSERDGTPPTTIRLEREYCSQGPTCSREQPIKAAKNRFPQNLQMN